MTTIASLPNEILIKIFKEYLLLPKGDLEFHDDMRFILLGVCRDWRMLTANERVLWTSIQINAHCVIPRLLQSIIVDPVAIFYRTILAFQCARHLPVDLFIDLPNDVQHFSLYHCSVLSMILRHEAPRIGSLTVSGKDWEMHLCALQGFKNQPMPFLCSFTHTAGSVGDVGFGDYANYPIPILQYPFQGDMDTVNQWGRTLYPNLSYINITSAPYNLGLLPTTGLREFGLSYMPINLCPPSLIRDILSYCADTLENLCIIGSLNDDGKKIDNNPVVLTKLETLFIEYDHPEEVAKFLPFIRAPALEQLDISDPITSYEEDEEDVEVNSTDNMLKAMMHSLPLNHIQRLTLLGVVFKDDLPIPARESFLVKGRVSPQDVPITLRFLASLTSLSLVTLCILDAENILPLLNYPRAPNCGTNGEALHDRARGDPSRHLAHLPALECIQFTALGDKEENDVQVKQFVDDCARASIRQKELHIVFK